MLQYTEVSEIITFSYDELSGQQWEITLDIEFPTFGGNDVINQPAGKIARGATGILPVTAK